MARNNVSIGLLLIGIAVVLLLGKLGIFSFLGAVFWPVFLLIPGIAFHLLYFNRMLPSGVLIPGGILVTISLLFFLCNLIGWKYMAYLWPVFPFAVAVGLYEYQLFDRNAPRGIWTASVILAGIAVLMLAMTLIFAINIYFIAIVLIAGGLFLMLRKPRW